MAIKKPNLGQLLVVVHPDGETEEQFVDRVQGQYIHCAGQRFHYLDDRTSDHAWEINNIGFIAQKTKDQDE
jgi:hypothetical protein